MGGATETFIIAQSFTYIAVAQLCVRVFHKKFL